MTCDADPRCPIDRWGTAAGAAVAVPRPVAPAPDPSRCTKIMTSSRVIRPAWPVPTMWAGVRPCSRSMRRTEGVIRASGSPAGPVDAAASGTGTSAAAGGVAGTTGSGVGASVAPHESPSRPRSRGHGRGCRSRRLRGGRARSTGSGPQPCRFLDFGDFGRCTAPAAPSSTRILRRDPGEGRRNLGVDLVGDDFEERLIPGDTVTRLSSATSRSSPRRRSRRVGASSPWPRNAPPARSPSGALAAAVAASFGASGPNGPAAWRAGPRSGFRRTVRDAHRVPAAARARVASSGGAARARHRRTIGVACLAPQPGCAWLPAALICRGPFPSIVLASPRSDVARPEARVHCPTSPGRC